MKQGTGIRFLVGLLCMLGAIIILVGGAGAAIAPVGTVTLGANPASPLVINTVTKVDFTAEANGQDVPGQYQYKFWLKDPVSGAWSVGRDYNTSKTWSWNLPQTPGNYLVSVYARNMGSSASYEAFTTIAYNVLQNTPVGYVTLKANRLSPVVLTSGGTVVFTADANGNDASGEYVYKFWLKDPLTGTWSVVQNYGDANKNVWTWTPTNAGTYMISVYTKNAGSPSLQEAYSVIPFTVVDQPPVSYVTLNSDLTSPALLSAGTVTFTADANGNDALGKYDYKFWLKDPVTGTWSVVQDFGNVNKNVWAWTPTDAGTYMISVYAKIAGRDAPYEAFAVKNFSITVDVPVSYVDLNVDNLSPISVGTTVMFAGQANGDNMSGAYEYKFWLRDPVSGTWSVAQAYGDPNGNVWGWTPTKAGTYLISVYAKNAGSAASYEAIKVVEYRVY